MTFAPLDDLLGWVGHLACHQAAGRTLWLDGHPLPFCMRCSGLYLGSLACVAVLVALRRWPAHRALWTWLLAVLLLLPTVADASLGHYVGWGLGPWLRMALGGLAGAAQVWLPLTVVAWRRPTGSGGGASPASAPGWVLATGVAALPALAAGAAAGSGWLGGLLRWLLGTASVAGFCAFVVAIVAAVLGLVLPVSVRRRRGIWVGASLCAGAATLAALHWIPSHWRNPFVWLTWLGDLAT